MSSLEERCGLPASEVVEATAWRMLTILVEREQCQRELK